MVFRTPRTRTEAEFDSSVLFVIVILLDSETQATPPCVADNNAESGIICPTEYVCQGSLDSVSHVLQEKGRIKRPNAQHSRDSADETDHRFLDAEVSYCS